MLALGHEQNREVGDWKDRTAQNRMRKEREEEKRRCREQRQRPLGL